MQNTIAVTVTQNSATAAEGEAREHKILIDRPAHLEGENKGPMGGEVFLMGLGGCFMSNLLAAIRTREAPVSDVRVDIIAVKEDAPPRFTDIELKISASYNDREMMVKLVMIAERGCLVANSIKNAIQLSFTISRSQFS